MAEWFTDTRPVRWLGRRIGAGAAPEDLTDGDPTVPHQPLPEGPRA